MTEQKQFKSLKEISWDVDEPTYREDPALSYSTLAKYERKGFNALDTLFDTVTSPSLTFGSCVDALITGGKKEFDDNFLVVDFPKTSETLVMIAKKLFDDYHTIYEKFTYIPDEILSEVGKSCDFWANAKYDNHRVKLIKEGCEGYYDILSKTQDKTIISEEVYKEVCECVSILKTNKVTKKYFEDNNPFVPQIERLYQLKFKATIEEINFRCMADELIVNHKDKWILPIDLKTSYHAEWDFYKSFLEWNYQIQARLYWAIIRDNMDKDTYFKDFKLLNYRFIVVNKTTLTPLVWECPFTQTKGSIEMGKNKQIILRDPLIIAKELKYYLDNTPKIPIGIKEVNNLQEWINMM